MGKQDVRQALVAMQDDEVRGHLLSGDFSDLDELTLTEHERQLVQGAASDYPDVAGFAYDAFWKYDLVIDEATASSPSPSVPSDLALGAQAAILYVKVGALGGSV